MNELTHEKISLARNEVADALYLVDELLGRKDLITSIKIGKARHKLSCAIAKLVSAESELALEEERKRA